MTHLMAITLGIVEGLTEFIPVSSSGHLIIVREIFGVNYSGGLAFDAVLQLATSCALLVYFWRDARGLLISFLSWITKKEVAEKDKIMLYAIIIGTIPAILFGLFLEKEMDTIFRNTDLVALMLILGSVLFWYAQKVAKQNKVLSLGGGIMIGFFQCLSLVPGISRSGATISGGLIAGLTQEEAVKFSFILSLPILFGAGLKKIFEIRYELLTNDFGLSLLLGSLTAFVTGLLAINFLIKYLKNHNLNLFIWYRIALSIAIFFLF